MQIFLKKVLDMAFLQKRRICEIFEKNYLNFDYKKCRHHGILLEQIPNLLYLSYQNTVNEEKERRCKKYENLQRKENSCSYQGD